MSLLKLEELFKISILVFQKQKYNLMGIDILYGYGQRSSSFID